MFGDPSTNGNHLTGTGRYRSVRSVTIAGIAFSAVDILAANETARSGTEVVGWYSEMWSLPVYAVKAFSNHLTESLATLLGAILLAALCWWAASAYSRLWNLRFRITPQHHALCLLAAASTLVFVVIFASLRYTQEAAEVSIDPCLSGSLPNQTSGIFCLCKIGSPLVSEPNFVSKPDKHGSSSVRYRTAEIPRLRFAHLSACAPLGMTRSCEIKLSHYSSPRRTHQPMRDAPA